MGEKDRLQDIPQFRTLEENLELRVALQQVDKLKAENVALKAELNEWEEAMLEMPGVVERPLYEDDEGYYPSMEEEAKNVLDEIEQTNLDYSHNSPSDEDVEDLFKDSDYWAHDSYENIVDPEFDRGFKMGQSWLIQDIIEYLKNIRDNGEA